MALNRNKGKGKSKKEDSKKLKKQQRRVIEEEEYDEEEAEYLDDGATEFTDFITGNLQETDKIVDDKYVVATMKGLAERKIPRALPIIEVDYTQELRKSAELMRDLRKRNRKSDDDNIIDSDSPSKFSLV